MTMLPCPEELEPCDDDGFGILRFVCEPPEPGQQPLCPPSTYPQPNLSGPDDPGIYCWIPNDCCAPSPCVIREDQFICSVRTLLPEGEIYNNTLVTEKEQPINRGTVTVGCARVGCEQLVFGGCCDDTIHCDDDPIAPQLAVVDAFAAAVYKIIPALCELLRELDPCTARRSIRRWAERMGLKHPDCSKEWSEGLLAALICLLMQLRGRVLNWKNLTEIAAMFGAELEIYYAGDLCGPVSCDADGIGWPMARNQTECPPPILCGDPCHNKFNDRLIRLSPTCESQPQSLNILLKQSDIILPGNCNLPWTTPRHLPHDDERYAAFKWLLPQIMPQPAFYCFYEA